MIVKENDIASFSRIIGGMETDVTMQPASNKAKVISLLVQH